jgi:hypothetical protein
VDPGLWTKHGLHGMVMIAIYFNDYFTNATEEKIEEVIHALKWHTFGLKVEGNLTNY